jgi:dihydrofolate reductase
MVSGTYIQGNPPIVKMIACVSSNGIIGKDNKLACSYKEDMQYFRKMTLNSTIVMGRLTFESIKQPLPKRRNIVISSSKIDVCGIETFPCIPYALEACVNNPDIDKEPATVWLIGGGSIYREGMNYADEIHLTITPDVIEGSNLVYFPWINPSIFNKYTYTSLDPPELGLKKYTYFRANL